MPRQPEAPETPAPIAPGTLPSGISGLDELGRVTRLAAYGVIRREEAVLLCRISPGYPAVGMWTLPGGGIEFGESPDVAALREVEEETGLVARVTGAPTILSHTGIWRPRAGRPVPVGYHHIRFVYPMEVVGGTERDEVDGSTDMIAWLTIAEAAELPIVGLVSLSLGLPVRSGEDEVPRGEVAAVAAAAQAADAAGS